MQMNRDIVEIVNAVLLLLVGGLGAVLLVRWLPRAVASAIEKCALRRESLAAAVRRERATRLVICYVPDARAVFERAHAHFRDRARTTLVPGERLFWTRAYADLGKLLELVPPRKSTEAGVAGAGSTA